MTLTEKTLDDVRLVKRGKGRKRQQQTEKEDAPVDSKKKKRTEGEGTSGSRKKKPIIEEEDVMEEAPASPVSSSRKRKAVPNSSPQKKSNRFRLVFSHADNTAILQAMQKCHKNGKLKKSGGKDELHNHLRDHFAGRNITITQIYNRLTRMKASYIKWDLRGKHIFKISEKQEYHDECEKIWGLAQTNLDRFPTELLSIALQKKGDYEKFGWTYKGPQ